MHLLIPFIVCLFLFMVFPKGFKFMVGSFVGLCAGGFAWAMAALVEPSLVTGPTFVGFIVAGIAGGCVVAANG